MYYHAESGDFVWLDTPRNSRRVLHKQAGKFQDGYLMVRLFKQAVYAHHLAWFYVYGVWPEQSIDHINGNGLDNRIENLRQATSSQNNQNYVFRKPNASGMPTGVNKTVSGKYGARIKANNVMYYLGLFPTLDDASAAYRNARIKLHDCPAFKMNTDNNLG